MASIALRRWIPVAVYALLGLAIVSPWFKPGYIFALDMVFTPQLHMPAAVTSSYLFHSFLHVLDFVLPSSLIQKVLLFCVFSLAGFGMHRLAQFLPLGRIGAYFAGFLYAINPFTYDRLMTGQYSVLLGYALLPFFVRSLLLFLQKPTFRQSFLVTLWTTIIGVISIHTLGPVVIIGIVGSTIWLIKNRRIRAWKTTFWRWMGAGGSMFAALNCYWLVPLLLGKGRTAEQIASFTGGDTAAFATVGGSFIGRLLHVLSLRGFWAEDYDLYLQPNQQIGVWGLLILLLWLLVIAGIINLWQQKHRALAALFGIITVAGCLLAVGFSVAQQVPLLAGFREPQKFASLVALGFAVLGGLGATYVTRFVKNEFESPVSTTTTAGIVLSIPLIITSTIFWGARGQLIARDYPPEWATINTQLNADRENFNTLFLPWHLYMRFEFADRVITNPAPHFFDKTVIVSDNPEHGRAAPVHPTNTTRKLDRLLAHTAGDSDFAKQLAALNIKYIILDHEEDYRDYDYVRRAPGLQSIGQHGTLELFRNELHGGTHETQ